VSWAGPKIGHAKHRSEKGTVQPYPPEDIPTCFALALPGVDPPLLACIHRAPCYQIGAAFLSIRVMGGRPGNDAQIADRRRPMISINRMPNVSQ